MKLSSKFKDIPAGELKDLCEHPENYDLSMQEFFDFAEQAAKLKNNDKEEQLIKMVDALKTANADLRYENERLRKAIIVLSGGESNDG